MLWTASSKWLALIPSASNENHIPAAEHARTCEDSPSNPQAPALSERQSRWPCLRGQPLRASCQPATLPAQPHMESRSLPHGPAPLVHSACTQTQQAHSAIQHALPRLSKPLQPLQRLHRLPLAALGHQLLHLGAWPACGSDAASCPAAGGMLSCAPSTTSEPVMMGSWRVREQTPPLQWSCWRPHLAALDPARASSWTWIPSSKGSTSPSAPVAAPWAAACWPLRRLVAAAAVTH